MENRHNLRGEKGRFIKAETIYELPPEIQDKVEHQIGMTQRMKDRRNEWRQWAETPEATPEAVESPTTYNITTVDQYDRITTVRKELAEMVVEKPIEGGELSPPLVIEGLPEKADGPIGELREKQMKKQQKELKEKSPKTYTDMLVVFNDTQLLRECDQEALGAFLKYVDANKRRITHIVANGDIADFSAQSYFSKDIDAMASSDDEVEATRWLIDHLSELLPDAEKVFIWGNHEERWKNLLDAEKGRTEGWTRSISERFGLEQNGWQEVLYGSGEVYNWNDQRIFWHGHRSSIHTSKAELADAGMSVTTGHINRNQYFETTDARGVRSSGIAHGGFSKDNLGFMKKAVTNWAQGFGVYFYDEKTKTETPYMVTMTSGKPRFIGPDGELYDGTGWSIPGFEEKRGRGRPKKIK